MKECNEPLKKVLSLVEAMVDLADEGDATRVDVGCGVLYGVLRDCAYKIGKIAEEERETHIRKGWWPVTETGVAAAGEWSTGVCPRTDFETSDNDDTP